MFRSKFLRAVGIVSILNILAMMFGFLRELTIGYTYGTSYQADSIITAFTIPNFLYVVLGGAVNTAFISIYSKMDDAKKSHFTQSVYTYLLIFSTGITILFMLFPTFWMNLFFRGMSPEALDLTAKLFVVTAPATLFLVVSMLFSGLHNTHGNYRLTTFTSLIFNVVYVMIGVLLTPFLAEYSYAFGASLGAFTLLFILLYRAKKQKLAPLKPKLISMPEHRNLFKLALPIILGGATMQFYLIIQRIFAAGLDEGAIAAINYTSKITQVPRSVIMASVTTIIYPMLAKAAGDEDFKKMDNAYKQGFRMLSILLIPATVFLYIYAKEIIVFIFEYGNFDAESTRITYPLLQVFALSVFSLSLNTYITRFYYALESMLLPNIFNIVSVFGINILIIMLFIDKFGSAAIAYGTVISALFNMLILIAFAKTKFGFIVCNWQQFGKLILYTIIAVGVIFAVALLPIQSVFFSLLVGGLVTLALIGIGLKAV